jgi:hypothetical protein
LGGPGLIAFLSVGRCGTQWLTENLRELYGERLEVEHEPIGPLYSPRRFFRRYEDSDAILSVPEVEAHVGRIERSRHYIETGWPLFPALPLLAARFPDRLRVVHLTRHPVPSSLSHLAHSSYAGSGRDDAYTRLATLGPADPNVFQRDYSERWGHMSPYEKCLFWWTEVNMFALEFEERLPHIPLLRVKSEEMLAGDPGVLERLVEHMGLPFDERWPERTRRQVDRWHHRTDRDLDPMQIVRHPGTLETARRLGYGMDEIDLDALRARYSGEPDAGADRLGRFGEHGAPRE